MAITSYHFVYLNPEIEEARWSHLHRFIHPGNANQAGWKCIVCTELEMSNGYFLSCIAKNYSGGGPKKIFLQYRLVDSIIEVASHMSQAGFADEGKFPDPQQEQ